MYYSEYLDYVEIAKIKPNVFTADVLNDVIKDGGSYYAGCSVAMLLASSDEGRNILANIPELADKIHPDTLNKIIPNGPRAGKSVAFCLADYPEGRAIFENLVSKIHSDTLNHIIPDGPDTGLSVAYCLACSLEGRAILANNHELASKIHPDTLNKIIPTGPHEGTSVAFWLSCSPEGRAIIEANNHELANKIRPDTLNKIIQEGELAGTSVAFWLASILLEGRTIFANNPELANKISDTALNKIIPNGPRAGQSVAFWLAGMPEGCEILANNPELARKIHPNTLNHIIQEGFYTGMSVAFWLAYFPEGCTILANTELASKIHPDTWSKIVLNGNFAGTSVAYWLARSPEGRAIIMEANKSRLLSNVPVDAIFTHNKQDFAVTCPLSLDVMRHPVKVTTFDGSKKYVHAFEREFLYKWISSNQQMINPVNRLPFTSDNIEHFQELEDYINTLAAKESPGLKQKASPDTYSGILLNSYNRVCNIGCKGILLSLAIAAGTVGMLLNAGQVNRVGPRV